MKPLVGIVTFNRLNETKETLAALTKGVDVDEIELVIVDNGSGDGTAVYISDWVAQWVDQGGDAWAYQLQSNIGCPRALNFILLEHRQMGQDFIKMDNDVLVHPPGWVSMVQQFILQREQMGTPVAMVGAYYNGLTNGRTRGMQKALDVFHINPVIGHTVWHTGTFLDVVGHFDVLHAEHLYGFEDLILSYKATMLGWELLTWTGWRIENIQRCNALGSKSNQGDHVAKMRPYYNERIERLRNGGAIYTGGNGLPT